MGQIGKVPEMLSSYVFMERKGFSSLAASGNFDGGGSFDQFPDDSPIKSALLALGLTEESDVPGLDRIIAAMMHHSSYLDRFLPMHDHVLKGDGPLSYTMRHYVAMMAASRHHCSYLFRMETWDFLAAGGDVRWLNFEEAPEKLKSLANLNKIMAHRPWLINRQLIKEMVSRASDNSRSWCLSELVHAIVVLSHFHSLSSFVYATGIEESESVDEQSLALAEPEKVVRFEEPEAEVIQERVQYLVDQMKNLSECEEELGDDPEERNKRFASVMEPEESSPGSPPTGSNVAVVAAAAASASAPKASPPQLKSALKEETKGASGNGKTVSPKNGKTKVKKGSRVLTKFAVDSDFAYQDFASRSQGSVCPTLRIQDCSWENQGFSLVSRLYSETSSVLLDDKHRTAYNLTYNTLSTVPNVDTSKFRRAVWNYILCLYGIRHDDYNYQEVNQLLQRELKTFIKRACCYPERLSGRDLRSAMNELKYSEKVHVLLMVMEARMEAELLYALRAIMQYLTWSKHLP